MSLAECERIVLWGSGGQAEEIIRNQDGFEDVCQIVDIFDNDCERWGKKLGGFVIKPPELFKEAKYDKIVISTTIYFDEVREQLRRDMKIEDQYIENYLYFAKKKIMRKYKSIHSEEIQSILKYLEKHNLDVFNYSFAEKYQNMCVEIGYDDMPGLFYVYHNGFRMYMARWLNTEEKVKHYYRSIMVEQDDLSPHKYLDRDFSVSDGDVVVDVGTAEGNFALEILDKASKIYLIEAEDEWIEALKYTFADYQKKVDIIHGYASDITDGNRITLNDVIKERVNFIKMDIEGDETKALAGADHIIKRATKLKCTVCVYHNTEDEKVICNFAKELGLTASNTAGYMYYPVGDKQRYYTPVLRRGIIRLKK